MSGKFSGAMTGVAALLLQRGCPVEGLDKAQEFLGNRAVPDTLREMVEDADLAVAWVMAQ